VLASPRLVFLEDIAKLWKHLERMPPEAMFGSAHTSRAARAVATDVLLLRLGALRTEGTRAPPDGKGYWDALASRRPASQHAIPCSWNVQLANRAKGWRQDCMPAALINGDGNAFPGHELASLWEMWRDAPPAFLHYYTELT